MNDQLAAALKEIREAGKTAPFDADRYLEACTTIVDHRAELAHRVHICLPGGMMGDEDPRWDHVKENSIGHCMCGDERVILPANQREEFEASEAAPVVVSGDENTGVYLKPVGGDKESTYAKIWIGDGTKGKGLAFVADPFAPLDIALSMLSTPCYPLYKVAEALPKLEKPLIMHNVKEKIPLFAIKEVDVAAGTVTIVLDKDVTLLTDEEIKSEGHHH